jgi:hypothetical protein
VRLLKLRRDVYANVRRYAIKNDRNGLVQYC